MNIERGNMWNQFLVSSGLVSLHAATKVLSRIWGPPFCSPPPGRGIRGVLPPALCPLDLLQAWKNYSSCC